MENFDGWVVEREVEVVLGGGMKYPLLVGDLLVTDRTSSGLYNKVSPGLAICGISVPASALRQVEYQVGPGGLDFYIVTEDVVDSISEGV